MRKLSATLTGVGLLLAAVLVGGGTTPVAAAETVLVGAGDIAVCSTDRDEATADLLDDIAGEVFTLGDNVYQTGTPTEFANCYDPSWGRHKARTRPVAGNHDYYTPNAAGYYGYFGAAAAGPNGWYSYDSGDWHVVVLNSNVAMGYGSAQMAWLQADLAANPATCTAAMWHHPLFSSGVYAPGDQVGADAWRELYLAGADLVLNGHEHWYERLAPADAAGAADPTGMRSIVVGTGGTALRTPSASTPVHPLSEVRDATSHGVLSLSLHADSYDWEFVPVSGDSFTDSGSGTCHEGPRSLPTTAASDSFSRTVSNGWGSAETGGAWSPSLASAFSVNGTTGRVLHNAAGNGRSAVLNGISETDLTIATTISIDKPATGSGAYTGVVLRRVSPGNEYVARLRWRSDGAVGLSITRRANGTETQITPETIIPGATTSQAIRLIADISGTGPTTINARAHAIGSPDPGTWQRSATDTSPTLQNPGAPGIATYLSSSTTNAPLTATYDDYLITGG